MRISDWSSDVCSSDLPQLDLAVVGGKDHMPRLRDKGVADAAAQFGANGDVLEIGIGGRQAARLGDRQRKAGVDTIRFRIDLGLEIGRASCRERVCQYV